MILSSIKKSQSGILFMILFAFSYLSSLCHLEAQDFNLESPSKKLSLNIHIDEHISFSVDYRKNRVMDIQRISMEINNGEILGSFPKLSKHKIEFFEELVTVQIPNKDAKIFSRANQISMSFKQGFQVIFRIFDDGVTYRFIDQNANTSSIIVEHLDIDFPDNTISFFPEEESMYSHNERLYKKKNIDYIALGKFCSLPVMFDTKKVKVLITEASLHNYPGMFLAKGIENSFKSIFPKYVLKAIPNEVSEPDRNQIITEHADYIAKVNGPRAYPWRVFIISDDDRTFVESNLVTQHTNSSKIPDADWIKPGKVAWDWYNANNIYGVDFKAGLNQNTYKYYIDFASKNGIEYVILDEGWTRSTTEILHDNENLDVPELIKYAKSKNVGIILWVLWKPLYESPDEILKLYSTWGAAGVKVDFMQRSDQYVVESYEKIAEIAAKYEMLVDYHGAFKPAGIERVWPNLINYEGVQGTEQHKWSSNVTPEHNVTIPFIRMAAGPMDYTPGSMVNMNRIDYERGDANYASLFTRPMSLGTRAHQVAMYVVYEAPLQMMCESPTIYYREQETVDFITKIPTVWDETHVLEGKVSDYLVVARRKGDKWYIGAMTDWSPRKFEINLSFLKKGNYKMEVFKDGINASRNAEDYKIISSTVNENTKVNLNLSSGGGWAAIIQKE